ncbi:MAG: hypothetical protein LIO65_04225, partial [Odoribacter sp.]|nr:hypothetical protein [Odoribacter sp.]
MLRILLGILILLNHTLCHGIQVYSPELYEANRLALNGLWALAEPAVNVFFLISGYFRITASKNKTIKLISMFIFYGTIMSLFSFCHGDISLTKLVFWSIMSWKNYWFIGT